MTYTYALLEVLPSTWADVRSRLDRMGYNNAFHEDNAIDMHGLALIPMRPPEQKETAIEDELGEIASRLLVLEHDDELFNSTAHLVLAARKLLCKAGGRPPDHNAQCECETCELDTRLRAFESR